VAHSEVRLHGGRPADKPSAPAHPISAKQTRSPLSEPPRTGVSYPAREPGFSALARGTPHSAPGAFEGLPARYWAVMKFIHDEGELTWLNNNPENRLPLGFAGRARRNARPAFFPAPAPRFSLRPCARRIPISAKQTRAARFPQHAISATCPPSQPPPPAARISVLRTVVGLSDRYQSQLLSMEAALCAGDISLFSLPYQHSSLRR